MALQNAVQPSSIKQLPIRTFEEQNPTVLVYKMVVTAVLGWEIIVMFYTSYIFDILNLIFIIKCLVPRMTKMVRLLRKRKL